MGANDPGAEGGGVIFYLITPFALLLGGVIGAGIGELAYQVVQRCR